MPLIDDQVAEQTEHFTVELSNFSGAVPADRTGTGTITDNDQGNDPALAIRDAQAVREGGTALFLVRLSTDSTQTVTVAYRTVDGTAEAGTDYTANQGTLQFAAGTVEQTIVVQTLNDSAAEPTETFTVELSSASNATLERDTGTGTIQDDDEGGGDRLPTLSIEDALTVTEGDTAEFAVTLSRASGQTVTVAFTTADGTAASGTDYTGASGTLTFEPGATRRTIEVATLDDAVEEPEEQFTITLSDPTGATSRTPPERQRSGTTTAAPAISRRCRSRTRRRSSKGEPPRSP